MPINISEKLINIEVEVASNGSITAAEKGKNINIYKLI